ncbi:MULTISPECIES: DUF6230 family protein [Actinomadura]|uniref:DUF6230 family protein n=1 Tax=Actinomadura yumaensis TaxID=111807 RepID=A0ABW2D373_9ACTN|nr:DUF6230 family protein [Actinomadura sp. J1-007]MWK39810.1 hypothetical protein [Actinomadura sp. J1-007]
MFLVPSLAALAVLGFGMAEGAVPVSFALSGRQMQVSADRLSGRGFGLYPVVVRSANGRRHQVMMLTMRTAEIYGLCQSATVDTPLGRYVLRLSAADRARPAPVSGLGISATDVKADVDFGSLVLNEDARTLGSAGSRGDYGVGAAEFTVKRVRVHAWMVAGGTLRVKGLKVAIGRDVPTCF